MALRLRRFIALLMLICTPVQVLAALDTALCDETGFGDVHGAAPTGGEAGHDRFDFGDVDFDTCGLCHLGASTMPVIPSMQNPSTPRVFVSTEPPVCIEHDPPALRRPPRSDLA